MVELEIDSEYLAVAARAVIEGGEYAMGQIDSTESERKADSSFVTEADRQSEDIIRNELAGLDIPVLGEEFGGEVDVGESYWVVDPIDGTQNYAYGLPFYGSSVGLVRDGEPVVGCFYSPEFSELYYAVEGEGAYRNSEGIAVSDTTDVGSAYVGLSGKRTGEVCSEVSSGVDKVMKATCAIQKGGYVGDGRLDACVYGPLYPWDFATVVLLVREAGGVVRRVDSGESSWSAVSNGMFVAGNEEIVRGIKDGLSADVVGVLTDESVL